MNKNETPYQKSNTLSIFSANCLNQHSPMASCHTCETVCPQKALTFQDGTWHAANCTLCGVCAMVCPTQVFQIDLPRLLQLPAQSLVLTCSQHASAPAEALRINCIQQLSPLAMIHLLYHHPSVTLYLPIEHCKQCAHQWYAQGLLQQLQAYRLPSEKLQIIAAEMPKSPVEENERRELLRNLFHRTEAKSKEVLVQAVEKISANFSSEEVRQKEPAVFPTRLPLYALYVKKQLPLPTNTELPFRQLQCTACTFCGACVHICPTEALSIKRKEHRKQLRFQPELCINCNLCRQICMQQGLEWTDFMTAEQFIQTPQQLAYADEQICSRCEHEFYQWPPNTEDTDPICSFCQ